MTSLLQRFSNVVSTIKSSLIVFPKYINRSLTKLLISSCKNNINWCTSPLIYFGANVNGLDKNSNTALHYAVKNRNETIMMLLMQHDAKASIHHFSITLKGTPWFIAIEAFKENIDDYKPLAIFLKVDRKNFATDAEFKKALLTKALLYDAEYRGQFYYLKNFKKLGADIFATNKDGDTLLHFAAKYNRTSAMRNLMEGNNQREFNLTYRNKAGEMPIHWAAKFHASDEMLNCPGGALQLLITLGTPVDAKDFSGNTVLHYALFPKHKDDGTEDKATIRQTLNLLINNGADENISNNKQQTLLHRAVRLQNNTALKYLLDRKTLNINSEDFNGQTPLHLAMYHIANSNIVKTLVTHAADVLAQDRYGNIPLHYLRLAPGRSPIPMSENRLKYYEKVIKLLSNSNYVQQMFTKNKQGQIPLQYIIAENAPIAIIKQLLNAVPDSEIIKLLNTTDNEGNTLLHTACEYNSKQLYQPEYDINDPEIQQMQNNALDIVMLLIDRGSNLAAKNNNGATPLAIAQEFGSKNILEHLQKHTIPISNPKNFLDYLLHLGSKRDIHKPLITAQYDLDNKANEQAAKQAKSKKDRNSIFPTKW